MSTQGEGREREKGKGERGRATKGTYADGFEMKIKDFQIVYCPLQ